MIQNVASMYCNLFRINKFLLFSFAFLPAVLSLSVPGFLSAAPAPANDDFDQAIEITTFDTVYSGTNSGADLETGEPDHEINGSNSVWWKFTAVLSGTYELSTYGSDFDTVMTVYTGSAVDSLTEIWGNNDVDFDNDYSFIAHDMVAGTEYFIAVDGYDGDLGNIELTVSLPAGPANDNFAQAIEITTFNTSYTGSNIDATFETGEPDHEGSGSNSVWWKFTASSSDTYELSTSGSDFDTVMAVYTGSSVDSLTPAGSNDDEGAAITTSFISLSAVSGTEYFIAVDGYSVDQGNITLQVGELDRSINGVINTSISSGTHPVSGAIITIAELDLSTISDDTGSFTFNELEAGIYSLHINGAGYETQTVSNIEVPNTTSVNQLNITLVRKNVYLPYALPYDYDGNGGIGLEDIIVGLQILSGSNHSPNGGIFTDDRKLLMSDILEAVRYSAGLLSTPSLSILSLESDLWEPLTSLTVSLDDLGTIDMTDSFVLLNELTVALAEVNSQDNSVSVTIPAGADGNVAVRVLTGQGDISNAVYAFVHSPSAP